MKNNLLPGIMGAGENPRDFFKRMHAQRMSNKSDVILANADVSSVNVDNVMVQNMHHQVIPITDVINTGTITTNADYGSLNSDREILNFIDADRIDMDDAPAPDSSDDMVSVQRARWAKRRFSKPNVEAKVVAKNRKNNKAAKAARRANRNK